jgi:hypothetical protein
MSGAAALREGIRRVNAAPALVAGMCTITLLIALPLSIALRGMLESHLGHSITADRVAAGGDYDWWREFERQATGLGTTFGLSIGGFGAVLNNVSGFLDNRPLAATIAGATAAWLLIWSFLSGGVIDRLARGRPTRASGFFAACGVHVWRLLRLGVVAAFVYYFLFAWVHPAIFELTYPQLTRDVTVERNAFLIRAGGYALFASLLAFFSVIFDYARIRLVVEERRSAIAALAASTRFIRRHFGSVAVLYLLNAVLFLLLAALYALLAPSVPGQGIGMWAALFLGQAYIIGRHYLKLLFYASQCALFQSAFAHAWYTAPPAVLWPESPAVEAIINAKPRPARPERSGSE